MYILFDVVIAAILLFFVWQGYKKGFVLTLCGFLAVFVAFIGATLISNALAKPVAQAIVPMIESGIHDTLEQSIQDSSPSISSQSPDVVPEDMPLSDVLEALEGVDVSQIQVPLGSLVDLDILWGLGPTLKVHAMTVGTVDGEFFSEFTSAGVNQTLHRICLKLTVPLTLMLPGGAVETVSETELCVAETVIVGQVPQAYLDAGQ